MKYETRHIPEGINSSSEHPLKDFLILIIGSLLLILSVTLFITYAGGWVVAKIPFSIESKISNTYDIGKAVDDKHAPELIHYLQGLTEKISKAQGLPNEIKVTVHFINSNTVNAFATLGGHVFLFRGLLEKLPNENTLVTVLAHEIAHIKHRHPLKSLSTGILLSLLTSAITGSTSSDLLGSAGLLGSLKFGRDMERESDKEAMIALHELYGHLNGGSELFRIFQAMKEESGLDEPAEMFSSHPLDEKRIEEFKTMAKNKGWQETGALTALPDFFKHNLVHRTKD